MRTIIVFLLLSLSTVLHAAELPPLDKQVTSWAESLGHGAVAAAAKSDGRWVYTIAGQPFAAGQAKVPAEQVLFEIGSISKVFTGILLADAVHSGKLGLDDTLAQRLPVKFQDPATGAVTLKQLATHTSCLPRLPSNMLGANMEDPYARYDNKALFEYLASAKLDAKPPCDWQYSNLGFAILGVVLETVHGKPWAALVHEKITDPLGMTDTVVELSPVQKARFAEPWSGDKQVKPWTFQAFVGAGGLRSSLADMSKFADALLAGAKGPLGHLWPLFAGDHADVPAVGGKIGLGLVRTKDSGHDSYSHDGGTGGYRSIVYVRPATGQAVVVLASNASANLLGWLVAWEAAGREPVKRSEIALPAEVLDEYVGVYSIDKSARFTLLRRGDGLIMRLTGQTFAPLFASAKDEFFSKIVDAQVSFRRDASGKIDGLTLHQYGRDLFAARDAGPAPRVEFPDAATLAEYTGEYDFGMFQPGATIKVRAGEGTLLATLTGQPEFPVFATGKDRFEYDIVVAALTFERDASGKVVALVLHQNGMDMRAPKR